MEKKKKNEELPGADEVMNNGGALPGELPDMNDLGFGEHENDSSLFVQLKERGQTFLGKFLRKVNKGGSEDLKYPGFLFAEYPSGELKILPANWSIGEKIAEVEEKGAKTAKGVLQMEALLMEITLTDIKEKKDDTSVKLFAYRFAPCPEAFDGKVQWNDQFKRKPARAGE